MRSVLVAALVSCAEGRLQSKARRFLAGLSADELQFIAEFMGASILESDGPPVRAQPDLANLVEDFGRARSGRLAACDDQDLKSILLLEFLRSNAVHKAPVALRAGIAS